MSHRWHASSKNKNKWLNRQNISSVSQQHIGPFILEESQIYILTRVNLLLTHFAMRYPVCSPLLAAYRMHMHVDCIVPSSDE